MADQYDEIRDSYEAVKRIPVGRSEVATLTAALPGLTGASVLDVGCGTGFYPRLFRRAGAARVLGVDGSAEMVAHARRVEAAAPLGIEYDRQDALALPVLGAFDLVTSIWLVGYAPGRAALAALLRGLAANLRPGGDLVVLAPNPDWDWEIISRYHRYGLSARPAGPEGGAEGRSRITVDVHVDPPFEFESFLWPPGAVVEALAEAGFTGVRRQETVVPEDAVAERGEEFWAELRRCPTFAVYRATLG
ncbi:SAM-dependent methyltransferase [Crossiella equi]|uniref:SAM-dependent methyltransferase n=1 Tax=Crossiella equi TaxID=130796 RepID=A0ABS5A932_9PSEU|nr:class I SAM-dependent methyltransferase [Crossiella equi]MBP2473088.1 SAM-dependent methyltransferase [Crossiella equi]